MDTHKYTYIVILLVLVLTTLACSLPLSDSGVSPTPTGMPEPTAQANQPVPAPAACPAPGSPVLPERPIWAAYPQTILAFLSAGGSSESLAGGLSAWGALEQTGAGVIEADLNGDASPEVIVALVDPDLILASGAPGNVLVYACADGAYNLVYDAAALYGLAPDTPELLPVRDINADGRPDLIYRTRICGASTCNLGLDVLAWDAATGTLVSELARPILGVPVGDIQFEDVNGDGVEEILVDYGFIGSAGAGPQRAHRETYTWDGSRYTLSESLITTPQEQWFPIHFLQDGDAAAEAGRLDEALDAYYIVLADPDPLVLMGDPQEAEALKVYTRYRIMITQAARGSNADAGAAAAIFAEYTGDGSGWVGGFMAIGRAFWQEYMNANDVAAGCNAAVAYATSNPTSYELLNLFGYANRMYVAVELCPFGG